MKTPQAKNPCDELQPEDWNTAVRVDVEEH
jgi:hypothetical protein